MRSTHFKLILVFIVLGLFSKAQDLIVKKDSTKLYCKIVSEDSLTIFFINHAQTIISEILKSEVAKYEFDWNKNKVTIAPLKRTNTHKEFAQLILKGGCSIPTGDYASKDVDNERSGMANLGFISSAMVHVKLYKMIGATVSYMLQKNGFDTKPLNFDYTFHYPGKNFTTTAGKWVLNGPMAGLHLILPFRSDSKLSFLLNFSAGYIKYELPEIDVLGKNSYGSIYITQYSSQTKAPVYNYMTGVCFKMSPEIGINFSVNYLSGKADFKGIHTTGSGGYSSYDNYTQKFTSLNIDLGLCIFLQK